MDLFSIFVRYFRLSMCSSFVIHVFFGKVYSLTETINSPTRFLSWNRLWEQVLSLPCNGLGWFVSTSFNPIIQHPPICRTPATTFDGPVVHFLFPFVQHDPSWEMDLFSTLPAPFRSIVLTSSCCWPKWGHLKHLFNRKNTATRS